MKSKIIIIMCMIAALALAAYTALSLEQKAVVTFEEESELPAGQKPASKKESGKIKKAQDVSAKKLESLQEENSRLRAQRAAVYEEMGIAYTRAGMFDEAITAYKESLKYNPNNAMAHYYLGLIYQKNRKETEKAVIHLKRYLYLEPEARNRDEVKYIIEMLLNKR